MRLPLDDMNDVVPFKMQPVVVLLFTRYGSCQVVVVLLFNTSVMEPNQLLRLLALVVIRRPSDSVRP
jgi:hypothetical protein